MIGTLVNKENLINYLGEKDFFCENNFENAICHQALKNGKKI